MALILAIEPDKKQASAVRALSRGSLNAQMLVADSTSHGLHQLDGRVPDLILTSLLLSPKDESALDKHLRGLDAEGHRVPTLVIPVLGPLSRSKGGLLTRLKKPKKTTGTEGCDPATFAAQITEYLDRAAAERALNEPDDDEPPIGARPRRTSIRAAERRVDAEPTPTTVEPMPVVQPASTVDPGSPFDEPMPQAARAEPTEERILKDPFSTEGLTRPDRRRADSAPTYGAILFAESSETSFEEAVRPTDVTSPPAEEMSGEPAGVDLKPIALSLRDTQLPPQKADGNDAWDGIAIEVSDTSLEITAEPIDLNAFVEELEAVVSSYGKTIAIAPPEQSDADRIGGGQAPNHALADPPIGLAKRYAWPALEGLPAGTDWETIAPGDPDYEALAGFMAAFEPQIAAPSRASKAAPIEIARIEPALAPRPVDLDSWITLAMRQRYSWPALEGIECVDLLAELESDDDGLYAFADPEPPAKAVAPPGPPAKGASRVEPSVKAPVRVAPPVNAAARVDAPVKAALRLDPSVKAAVRVEPSTRAAVRVEPPVKATARVEPATKAAVRLEPAPRPTPPAVPVASVPRAVPSPPVPTVAATAPDPAAGHASPSAPPAAQWLEILSAIRRDIQELRAEHRADLVTNGETRDPGAPVVARSKAVPSATAEDATARSAKARRTPAPTAPLKPVRRRKRGTPPKQDEWGFFDPDQCGFAALLAKLEEIESDEPTTPEQS